MIPELGHFALILALLMAAMQLFAPLARRAAALTLAYMLAALTALLWSYLTFDFTVIGVAEATHTLKPPGAHIAAALLNADMLLLSAGTALAFYGLRRRPQNDKRAGFLPFALIILAGAALFIAHPFARIYPPPFEGIGYEAALGTGENLL